MAELLDSTVVNGSMQNNTDKSSVSVATTPSPVQHSAGTDPAVAGPTAEAAAPGPAPPAAESVSGQAEHPFETDPGDHAETPFEAYEHLDLLLTRLAKRLGTTKAALRVYDPYFCEGRMVQHMAKLGFETVHNRNEDFYEVKAAGRCPEYDVLVTNPPFSGDHLERIFKFAFKSSKPWCLLVPQYVARKAFYLEWLNNQRPKGVPKPCFLAPTRTPYVFTAPDRADVREMRLPGQAADPSSSSSSSAAGADSSTTDCLHNNTTSTATSAAADAAAASLSKLALSTNDKPVQTETAGVASGTAAEGSQAGVTAAPPPPPAAAAGPGAPKAFDVAAGSFQCVWFFSLGERHHKPTFEWLQQQQQQSGAESGGAGADAGGPTYTVVATMKDVPQLMAAPKLSPAERRWRKKMAAAGGQPQDGDPQQQQQQEGRGRAAGGRPGSGRQQQQQQQGGGGRSGARKPQPQQFEGRVGGRFGVAMGTVPQQQGGGLAGGRQAGSGRQQQQQQPAGRPSGR